MSDVTAELLPGSAETWRDDPPAPRVSPSLRVDRTLPPSARLAAWKRRHQERGAHARAVFHDSRNPERGLPVARRAVGGPQALAISRTLSKSTRCWPDAKACRR